MGDHIIDGQFQSDKYPWCRPGFVPLKLTDSAAQPLLWQYAQRRRAIDAEFADDLESALRTAGYDRTSRWFNGWRQHLLIAAFAVVVVGIIVLTIAADHHTNRTHPRLYCTGGAKPVLDESGRAVGCQR